MKSQREKVFGSPPKENISVSLALEIIKEGGREAGGQSGLHSQTPSQNKATESKACESCSLAELEASRQEALDSIPSNAKRQRHNLFILMQKI